MQPRESFCLFCGRRVDDCPGGLWNNGFDRPHGICRYCARSAVRAFGEAPDASPSVVRMFTSAGPGPDAA